MNNRKALEGMQAFSYVRWSSEGSTTGDSLTRQIERTRAVCASLKLKLNETVRVDKAVSGYTGDNLRKGALGKFIEAVECGKIKTPCVLVVEALDRLTRMRVRDARKLFERLIELDVRICTAHNEAIYDEESLNNPMELIISLMELSAGHAYAKELGKRLSAAWTRKKAAAANGELLTARVPGWLKVNPKTRKIEKVPERVAIVQQIFKDFLGGKGTRLITLELNRKGVKPFGHGKGWSDTSVRRTLKASSVIGQYQPRKYISATKSIEEGTAVDGYYPAIVDKVTFYAVQDRIKGRHTPRGPRNNCVNLFTGLVKCAHCEWPMILKCGAFAKAKTRKPFVRLLCSKAWRGQGCEYRTVRYDAFERGMITAICLKLILLAEQRKVAPTDLAKLKAELADAQAKLERLNNAARNAPEIPKNMVALSSEFEAKVDSLKQKIAVHQDTPVDNPFANWKQLVNDVDNRRHVQTLLTSEIETITLNSKTFSATVKMRSGNKWSIAWDDDWEFGCLLGKDYQFYLDNILFWKGPLNPSGKLKPVVKDVADGMPPISIGKPNFGYPAGQRVKIVDDVWSSLSVLKRKALKAV
jgi:DNA invertase Pin-like site-specific DNA recombinase